MLFNKHFDVYFGYLLFILRNLILFVTDFLQYFPHILGPKFCYKILQAIILRNKGEAKTINQKIVPKYDEGYNRDIKGLKKIRYFVNWTNCPVERIPCWIW